MRRHYLIASYSKPRIADDWTVGAVLIAGLGDGSGFFSPQVAWNVREWLNLGLYGYVPVHGDGLSEYGAVPYAYRVLFEARGYY